MTRHLLPLALLTICLAAQATAPQTPPEGDTEKFIRLTQQLERQPFGDSDKSMRSWLLGWVKQSPDITVRVCDVLGPIPGEKVPNGPMLYLQMMFGNAAFQLAHPDQRDEQLPPQMAGVRSAMAAYRAILAARPDDRIPYFDELLARERDGTLEQYMAPLVAVKCRRPGDGAAPVQT